MITKGNMNLELFSSFLSLLSEWKGKLRRRKCEENSKFYFRIFVTVNGVRRKVLETCVDKTTQSKHSFRRSNHIPQSTWFILDFSIFYVLHKHQRVAHVRVCASCVPKHHKRPDRLTQYIQVNNTHSHQLKNQLKGQWGSGKTEKKSRKWKNSKSPQLIKCGGFGSIVSRIRLTKRQ